MPNRPRTHQPQRLALPAQEYRPTAGERGYNHRWRKYRRWFLLNHPLCVWADKGVQCGKAAEVVDHKVPVRSADDPGFWDEENHAALCREHHAVKTGEDRKRGLTR